jgi:hypothetical protein
MGHLTIQTKIAREVEYFERRGREWSRREPSDIDEAR